MVFDTSFVYLGTYLTLPVPSFLLNAMLALCAFRLTKMASLTAASLEEEPDPVVVLSWHLPAWLQTLLLMMAYKGFYIQSSWLASSI